MRVVSLLPSATEIVACVGGESMLVGRSHECNFPKEVVQLPALTAAKTTFENSRQMNDAVTQTLKSGTGLYTIDSNLLKELDPDVIVTQSLCAVCSVDYNIVTKLADTMKRRPVIVDLNPQSLQDVLEGCRVVGMALGLEENAKHVVESLKQRVEDATDVIKQFPHLQKPTVAFLEWVDPIFVGGHWTPQLIHMAGASHPLNSPKDAGGAAASYVISNEDFSNSDPDWIIICPCGLDIEETEKEMKTVVNSDWWSQLRAVREQHVVMVDGDQMFNRPGPRLVDALEWLVALLHGIPERFPTSFPWKYLQSPTK